MPGPRTATTSCSRRAASNHILLAQRGWPDPAARVIEKFSGFIVPRPAWLPMEKVASTWVEIDEVVEELTMRQSFLAEANALALPGPVR